MIIGKFLLTVLGAAVAMSGVYDLKVPKINGGDYELSASQGKKLLIVVLPASTGDSADTFLGSVDSLAAQHANLRIIAVPALEYGFNPANRSELADWYTSKLKHGIIITDGLYVKKSSGNQQHPLFKWLTTVSSNGTFDTEVEGPGSKYFIDDNGLMRAVLHPKTKLNSTSITTLLSQ